MTPLPPARSLFERWLRAIALAGRGSYTEAAGLAASLQSPEHPAIPRSTAASLEASILRQQGEHARAIRLDTLALSLLPPGEPGGESPEHSLARCDGLTGLAADDIGTGRLDQTKSALEEAEAHLAAAEQAQFGWRARIRWTWVRAEAAMAGGDFEGALLAAQSGLDLAQPCPSLRHRVKSRLVLAAALTCAGSPLARACAREAHDEAEAAGLVPLVWAAAMLLHAVEPDLGWGERAARVRGRWT